MLQTAGGGAIKSDVKKRCTPFAARISIRTVVPDDRLRCVKSAFLNCYVTYFFELIAFTHSIPVNATSFSEIDNIDTLHEISGDLIKLVLINQTDRKTFLMINFYLRKLHMPFFKSFTIFFVIINNKLIVNHASR